jgi:endonuclease I
MNHLRLVVRDISCKQQEVLDERKSQQIQVHPLIPLYTYCHMQLKWNYFARN